MKVFFVMALMFCQTPSNFFGDQSKLQKKLPPFCPFVKCEKFSTQLYFLIVNSFVWLWSMKFNVVWQGVLKVAFAAFFWCLT